MTWPLPHIHVLRGTWTPVHWAQRLKRVFQIDIEACPNDATQQPKLKRKQASSACKNTSERAHKERLGPEPADFPGSNTFKFLKKGA